MRKRVFMYACMHLCMYACMHVCMYACMHVCMYACMHVCMYACMLVCMYACMHVCMHACCVRVVVRVYAYVYVHVCVREDVCVRLRVCAFDVFFLPWSQPAEFVASAHLHKLVTYSITSAEYTKFVLKFEHNSVVGWSLETNVCKV